MTEPMQALNLSQKKIFVVLGMARSGTSVIMRSLSTLGIEIGNQLVPPEARWNPTGFWEDRELSLINCGVLYALNYPWDSVSYIECASLESEKLFSLKAKAKTLLIQRMVKHTDWGFKDPRTAKIIPFWKNVFSELQLQDHYVIALRNPLAVACSYQALRPFDIETGLLLWLMHVFPAIEETHTKKRIVVSYERMLDSPRHELERLRQFFDLPALKHQKIENYINEFLNPKLKHYSHDEARLATHTAVNIMPLCRKVYALLLGLAKDKIQFDENNFLIAWEEIKTEFFKFYPLLTYVDKLLKQNKSYARDLHSIKKSILWKCLLPLHRIDEHLRARRRLKREKNKLRVSL